MGRAFVSAQRKTVGTLPFLRASANPYPSMLVYLYIVPGFLEMRSSYFRSFFLLLAEFWMLMDIAIDGFKWIEIGVKVFNDWT
jgi:hypothetical protein